MLTDAPLEAILSHLPKLTVGVVGDLFLDRYLDLDAALTECSLETGLDAYQVIGVRSSPGAAGTVINNLAALGVGRVCAVSVIGGDGEGFELIRALDHLRLVDVSRVVRRRDRRTPTYIKPMLGAAGATSRELNRLDIKNRTPLPKDVEASILGALDDIWPRVDVLLALDQVSEADCGVISARVRQRLAELASSNPDKFVLADSRERVGLFRAVMTKPNETECSRAVVDVTGADSPVERSALELARRIGRPVFCTCGERGMIVVDPRCVPPLSLVVPAFPVTGPIDSVGAGDSTSAALACALASGASLPEAAALGNLVASITIQQIGTTGTATPEQVRQRWRQVR